MINLLQIKLLLPLLILSSSLPQYPISLLQEDFSMLVDSHSFNETVEAFSHVMKISLKIQVHEKQLGEINFLTTPESDFSCETNLEKIIDLVKTHGFKKSFDEVYILIQKISSYCTSLDFKSSSLTKYSPYGCAACVVLTRIFENYIALHAKDITDFIEK